MELAKSYLSIYSESGYLTLMSSIYLPHRVHLWRWHQYYRLSSLHFGNSGDDLKPFRLSPSAVHCPGPEVQRLLMCGPKKLQKRLATQVAVLTGAMKDRSTGHGPGPDAQRT